MADQLLPPGVSVIQEFQTTAPTILTPTLPSCIIGPAFQVIEALEQDANGNNVVNDDAIASVPPILDSLNAGPYAGLDGLTLIISVNNGAAQTVTFSDPTAANLTAGQVVSQILATSGITGWAAYAVEKGSSTYVQIRGNTAGDNQTVQILAGTANTILGFPTYFEASGFSTYTQDKRFIAQSNFPDPRSNIDELDIDEDSIRVFINRGGSLVELKRDETFLRNGALSYQLGTAITFPTSALNAKTLQLTIEAGASEQEVTFVGEVFEMNGTLVVPGNAYAQPGTDAIQIQKNQDTAVTVTFATPADIAAAVTAINAAWAATYSGEDVCYRADASGVASGSGTFIAFQVGGATATGDFVKVIEGSSGDAFVDLGFTSGTAAMSSSLVYLINQALNAPTAQPVAADGGSDKLKLQSWAGYMEVGDGTGNTILGLTDDTIQYALEGVDDGDGDTKSPIVRLHNEDFTLDPNAAQIVGTADVVSAENQVHQLTFQVALNGEPMQEITFNGGPIVPSSPYSTPGTNTLGLIVNGTAKTVTFTSPTDIDDAILEINTEVGQTVCYKSDSAGVYSASGTYISFQVGGQTDAGGSIVIDYSAGATAFAAIGFAGTADIYQTLTGAEIVTAINLAMGSGFASLSTNYIQLDSSLLGVESKIEIGLGTANSVLGFTDSAVDYGRAFKPASGDALYADGALLGYIIQVAPGAVATDLRLDRELSFATALKKNWYIQALEIPSSLPATRPTPDLTVNLAGDITLKNDVLRDTKGDPVQTASDQLLIAYNALRLDLSPDAENPALLTFETTDELESLMAPLNTDNPLGLGLFFALINGPTVSHNGIGVTAVSADYPDGTLEGYTKALTFLESKEVYSLVPLTHESTIHQAVITHVDAMSDPDARGERIAIINPSIPTRELDTLAVSGTDGDYAGVANTFDTKQSNLASALLAAGVDPTGTIPVSEGVFLDIASDSYNYSVQSINGTEVTLRVAFAPGENDDAFYATSNLPITLISETFSIKVRGAELVDANGDPDKALIAETYQNLGKSYDNRRVVMTAPEKCAATINGVEQILEGYYMNCGIAGMIGRLPPQQGFTNYPMTGYTRVINSNGYFSSTQLNIGAAGGTYWIIQEVDNGPLLSRWQLTTDLTSVETRELSITRVVDYVAKFLRAGLRSFIGKFNITQALLDTLSTVIQGMFLYLVEQGILIGGDLNNILQDEDNPDRVLIDTTLDVPIPCNAIRLVLLV